MCQANLGIGETNIQTKSLAFMNLHRRVRMCIGWGEERLEAVCQTVIKATEKYKGGRKDGTILNGLVGASIVTMMVLIL